jgi:hypothetical protein
VYKKSLTCAYFQISIQTHLEDLSVSLRPADTDFNVGKFSGSMRNIFYSKFLKCIFDNRETKQILMTSSK